MLSSQKARITIGEIGLLLIKIMKYGIVHFLLYEYLAESPNCVFIPNIHC